MATSRQPAQQNSAPRAVIFLVLALVAGMAATVMVYQLVQSYKAKIAEAQKPEETAMAVVAAGDLFAGVVITEQDLVQVEIPISFLPPGAFTSPELVVGRVPRERILANEFVLPDRLADADAGIGLNALIPEGMRAISINIQDGAALSGFLVPGNLVDVLVTIVGEKPGDDPQTITLLQAVPVLAVNNRLLKEDVAKQKGKKAQQRSTRPSVTLAVTPEQAEEIAHAEARGTITLALRNNIDVNEIDVGSVDNKDVLGEEDKPEAPKPKARVAKPKEETTTLQIIKGTNKNQLTVGKDGQIKRP